MLYWGFPVCSPQDRFFIARKSFPLEVLSLIFPTTKIFFYEYHPLMYPNIMIMINCHFHLTNSTLDTPLWPPPFTLSNYHCLCCCFEPQVYINHFGWQMQHRLQAFLKQNHDGELPVGLAVIIETLSPDDNEKKFKNPEFNEGKLIKYLISTPTMRIPMNVSDTVNAYLAFRAVIRAG